MQRPAAGAGGAVGGVCAAGRLCAGGTGLHGTAAQVVGVDVTQYPALAGGDTLAVKAVVLHCNPVLLLVVGEEGAGGHAAAHFLDAVAAFNRACQLDSPVLGSIS